MLARLYWAATSGETLRSSTAAWALIRSHSIGRDASEAATAAASWSAALGERGGGVDRVRQVLLQLDQPVLPGRIEQLEQHGLA